MAEPPISDSDSVDKKWSYESGFSATGKFLDGGVKRLMILGMSEKTRSVTVKQYFTAKFQ